MVNYTIGGKYDPFVAMSESSEEEGVDDDEEEEEEEEEDEETETDEDDEDENPPEDQAAEPGHGDVNTGVNDAMEEEKEEEEVDDAELAEDNKDEDESPEGTDDDVDDEEGDRRHREGEQGSDEHEEDDHPDSRHDESARGRADRSEIDKEEDEEEVDEDDYPPDEGHQLQEPAASGEDAMDDDEVEEDREGAEEDVEEGAEAATTDAASVAASSSAAAVAAGGLARLQEASYSTRGRTGDQMDPLERLAREALGESTAPPKDKDRESFLNDAITEEERRTRTRYIPAVEGMHALRKHEIKSDLALARALTGAGGSGAASAAAKPKARRGNSMDVDMEEATSVDEDRSDMARTTTKVVEIGSTGLVIPSPAFVSPSAPSDSRQAPTPREVDEVTAFNPPRPPESVGPKKKHRMLRWERRPADIEVDLNNYRKTVHRTRDELRRAQDERDRLWTVDNHLTRNFLLHLEAMSKEWKRLNEELAAVQQECVNSADLLTSRTRSRGAGKGSYAMRDVLTVLRSRGQEIEAKGLTIPQNASAGDAALSGLGGVNCVSFEDWHRDTKIVPTSIASCWLLPGDAVVTPYGDGVVVAVYGADPIDVSSTPHPDLTIKGGLTNSDVMEVDSPSADKGGRPESDNETAVSAITTRQGLVAPRVAVRLPFGVGYFPAGVLISKEDPTAYTDARLALRWKGILDTGLSMGSFLDVAAMSEPSNMYRDGGNSEEDGSQDLDNSEDRVRLLPFGSRMLPTCNGRGVGLFNMTPEILDEEIDLTMLQGCAVLGRVDNPGVPKEIRKIEDENQEEIVLRAKALQLRNELYRQRRVRMLNERTYASTQERAVRVESLVAEMRTDLKTLKRRLDEEVAELGISESEAEGILTAYYKSLDSQLSGDASPHKRPRRQSRTDSDNDAMEEDVEQTEAISTDLAGPSQ